MVIFNKNLWVISLLYLFSMPLKAGCEGDGIVANITETHVNRQVEGKITANTLIATDMFSVGNISGCNNNVSEELRFNTTLPDSDGAPIFFRIIDGVPTYYLNKHYAYSIKMNNSASYTGKGKSLSTKQMSANAPLSGAMVSIYAAVDNPEPLMLSSVQIGNIQNEKHDVLMKLKLSANIKIIENCMILNKQTSFDFGDLELSQLPDYIGKTEIKASNSILINCSNDRSDKNVSIILSDSSPYAEKNSSVIASDNPGLGFVLYYGDKQVTNNRETKLGTMAKNMNPEFIAYLYKLKKDITPGRFSGTAEYMIKFD